MKSNKTLNLHYVLIQGIYWTIMACTVAYNVPLLQERGFSSVEIGTLNAVKCFVSVLSQPLIAGFVDRNSARLPLNYIAAALFFFSAVTTALFLFLPHSFFLTLVIFILFGASLNCMTSLVDALAMQFIRRGIRIHYSLARGMGSITWAVACLLIGRMVNRFGMDSMLVLQLVQLLFLTLAVVTFRKCREEKMEGETPAQPVSVFGLRPRYLLFLTATGFMFLGRTLSSDFLIDVVERLGGTTVELGYCQFVLAMSEIPVAVFFLWYRKKLGLNRIMILCGVFNLLKIAGTTFAGSIPVLILSQAFQSLGIGAFWSISVFFVLENIDEEHIVKGQSFVNIANIGFGSGVGGILSGVILNYRGLDALLYAACAAGFAGLLCMIAVANFPACAVEREKAVQKPDCA